MCIRDSDHVLGRTQPFAVDLVADLPDVDHVTQRGQVLRGCLLYTSDAADERSSVDLGGRRIIKKKKKSRKSTENQNMSLISEKHILITITI